MPRNVVILVTAAAVGAVAVSATRGSSAATVRGAPAACIAAIAEARSGFVIAGKAMQDEQPLFNMVGQAARAGAAGDAVQITAIAGRLHTLDAQLNQLTARLVPLAVRFNANAAACR